MKLSNNLNESVEVLGFVHSFSNKGNVNSSNQCQHIMSKLNYLMVVNIKNMNCYKKDQNIMRNII